MPVYSGTSANAQPKVGDGLLHAGSGSRPPYGSFAPHGPVNERDLSSPMYNLDRKGHQHLGYLQANSYDNTVRQIYADGPADRRPPAPVAKTPVDNGGGILENAFIQQKLKTMGGAATANAHD